MHEQTIKVRITASGKATVNFVDDFGFFEFGQVMTSHHFKKFKVNDECEVVVRCSGTRRHILSVILNGSRSRNSHP